MRGNRNRKPKKGEHRVKVKVTRCSVHARPVFEHEVCDKFVVKVDAESQQNCKNCKYSF